MYKHEAVGRGFIHYHILHEGFIRHINPLMFDVIDDKPEGVARGVYHV